MKFIIRGLIAFWLGFALAATFNVFAHAQSPWPLAPPARYDHPYKGHLNTIVVPSGTARQNCYKLGGGAVMPDNTAACAIVGNGHCTIVLPRSPVADLVKALRRHEIAHCNGWPSNHPA